LLFWRTWVMANSVWMHTGMAKLGFRCH